MFFSKFAMKKLFDTPVWNGYSCQKSYVITARLRSQVRLSLSKARPFITTRVTFKLVIEKIIGHSSWETSGRG
jgi:hypothetical protein